MAEGVDIGEDGAGDAIEEVFAGNADGGHVFAQGAVDEGLVMAAPEQAGLVAEEFEDVGVEADGDALLVAAAGCGRPGTARLRRGRGGGSGGLGEGARGSAGAAVAARAARRREGVGGKVRLNERQGFLGVGSFQRLVSMG